MALTLGNWLFIGITGGIIVLFVLFFYYVIRSGDVTFVNMGLVALLTLAIWLAPTIIGLNWYNTSTASGIRAYKDFQSEIDNGIDREITITAEDGREIFHYEGKVDIESNHEDNYIKFEGEDGRRYLIYYGIQDTITIIEKEN